MKLLTNFVEVYLYTGLLDMRLGIDRLDAKIKEECRRSVISGGLYVFVSRCRKKIKFLYWDKDGYALWIKRLEAGTYKIEKENSYEIITGLDLEKILTGTEYSRIKFQHKAEKGLINQANCEI